MGRLRLLIGVLGALALVAAPAAAQFERALFVEWDEPDPNGRAYLTEVERELRAVFEPLDFEFIDPGLLAVGGIEGFLQDKPVTAWLTIRLSWNSTRGCIVRLDFSTTASGNGESFHRTVPLAGANLRDDLALLSFKLKREFLPVLRLRLEPGRDRFVLANCILVDGNGDVSLARFLTLRYGPRLKELLGGNDYAVGFIINPAEFKEVCEAGGYEQWLSKDLHIVTGYLDATGGTIDLYWAEPGGHSGSNTGSVRTENTQRDALAEAVALAAQELAVESEGPK